MAKITLEDLQRATDILIKDGGYNEPKEGMLTEHQRLGFNRMLAEYKRTTSEIDRELLYDQMVTQYAMVRFAGADPKTVPTSLIKYFQQNPPAGFCTDQELKSRERIRNPNKGIRSFCISCMGGAANYVRDCPSATCPLWPFRMGTNPFYGRLVNVDTEAELDASELEDEEEANADQ